MNRILQMKKSTRSSLFTYGLVIGAYLIIQLLRTFREGGVGSVLEGQLVPICAYVTMALALNLVVGVSGELSLGHAGFMSIGAFAGCSVAAALQNSVEMEPLRLALAMVLGGVIAGIFGFLIGVPVLRLNGDYLAIVTLAFGEIIKSLVTNVYLGVDENGLHFSFLSDNTNLSETGVELIRGPVGVTNSARIATFTAGVVLVLVALFVIFNLVNSRTGRAIMAARDNRQRHQVQDDRLCYLRRPGGGRRHPVRLRTGHLYRHQVRLQHLHSDPGVCGAGRPGQHVGLGDRRRRPDHPARGPAPVRRLPDAGVRHRADPGHAGHQQPHIVEFHRPCA